MCEKNHSKDYNSTCNCNNFQEHEINCTELVYSDEEEEQYRARRFMLNPNTTLIHSSSHLNDTRRSKAVSGGFCEVGCFRNKCSIRKKHNLWRVHNKKEVQR